jgi:hypothetical protein
MSAEPSIWKLEINGPAKESETLSEIVRLIAGGGWTSSRWLAQRLKQSAVGWIEGLARIAEARWKVKKLIEPDAHEIHMSGEHPESNQKRDDDNLLE